MTGCQHTKECGHVECGRRKPLTADVPWHHSTDGRIEPLIPKE